MAANTAAISAGSPLQIDFVRPAIGGMIGMTHCPGRNSMDIRGIHWSRDLAEDISAIAAHRIGLVVSLLDDAELARHGAQALPTGLATRGIDWVQFAIEDFQVPGPETIAAWRAALPGLQRRLSGGDSILMHCAAGLGRTGMMAATLLIASGETPEAAIHRIRQARPGTIETAAQETFVRNFASGATAA